MNLNKLMNHNYRIIEKYIGRVGTNTPTYYA